jgi:predicted RNase H-like HicB family nuclease
MGLFEDRIAANMSNPAFRRGWEEAEAELFALRTIDEAVLEPTFTGWSAYVPSVPGVGVAARTRKKTKKLLLGALAMHYEALGTTWACKHVNLSVGNAKIINVTCGMCP